MKRISLAFALLFLCSPAWATGPGHGEPASITSTRPFSASQTPGIADCSTVYQAAGSAGSITLPASSSVPDYCWFRVNALNSSVVIAMTGTDTLNGGSAGVGVTVQKGYEAFFYTTEDGAWWYSLYASWPGTTGATLTANPSNPTGNATSTNLMMGMGGTCAITPNSSTRVRFHIEGTAADSSSGGISQIGLRYGTGTAPANGVAVAGTLIGNRRNATSAAAAAQLPFSISGIITGLTPGTAYWFDADLAALGTAGTATITNVTCGAFEL